MGPQPIGQQEWELYCKYRDEVTKPSGYCELDSCINKIENEPLFLGLGICKNCFHDVEFDLKCILRNDMFTMLMLDGTGMTEADYEWDTEEEAKKLCIDMEKASHQEAIEEAGLCMEVRLSTSMARVKRFCKAYQEKYGVKDYDCIACLNNIVSDRLCPDCVRPVENRLCPTCREQLVFGEDNTHKLCSNCRILVRDLLEAIDNNKQ